MPIRLALITVLVALQSVCCSHRMAAPADNTGTEDANTEAASASASAREEFRPFSFAVAADPHLRQGADKLDPVAEKIKALPPERRPAFLLICGDLGAEELPQAVKAFDIPVHVTPGNAESVEDRAFLRKAFADDFKGKDFYSFEHNGCRFISLCTAVVGDHVGHLSSEDITPPTGQSAWFEKELAVPAAHTFVFGHIPPHPKAKDAYMYLGQNDARFVNSMIQSHRPTALFFGHQHHRRRFTIGDSEVFVIRSCSHNNKDEPAGFLLVHVQTDGIATEFVEIR